MIKMNYDEWHKALKDGITKLQVELIKDKMEELQERLKFFDGLLPDPDYWPHCGYLPDIDEDDDEYMNFDWDNFNEEEETNKFYIKIFNEEYTFNIKEEG
jgi:hypothetical protein